MMTQNVILYAEGRPECITCDSFYVEYMLLSFVGVHYNGKKIYKNVYDPTFYCSVYKYQNGIRF